MSQSMHLEHLGITQQQAGHRAISSPASPGTELQRNLLGQLSYHRGHTYSVFSLDFDLLLPFGYLPRVLPTCNHPCCLCPAPAAPEAMDLRGTHWILAINLPWDRGTGGKETPGCWGEVMEAAAAEPAAGTAITELQTPAPALDLVKLYPS